MPRQQVYGKRSRAIYTNFAIFDSPQRPSTAEASISADVETLVHDITGLSLQEYAKDVEQLRRRKALGERDVNTVVSPVAAAGKKTRGRKVKKVMDDEDEDRSTEHEAHDDRKNHSAPLTAVAELKQEVQMTVQESCEAVIVAAVPSAQSKPIKQEDHLSSAQSLSEDVRSDDGAVLDATTLWRAESAIESHVEQPPQASETDIYSHHCAQLLESSAHGLSNFEHWSEQLSAHFSITKIAEASFGEVYRLSLLHPVPGLSTSDESVFKIIPLQPPNDALPKDKKKRATALKKADHMSRPDDVANEVKVLQRMSSIPGFTNFRDVRLLQGRPPRPFIDAFTAFNIEQEAKKKDLSHFPDPSKKACYSDDQLWAVIEMQDAGTDLERLVEVGNCSSIWTVWDTFWQVVLSLAKGEEGAEFEHRDLHLGNICVRRPTCDPQAAAEASKAVDVKKKLGFTSLETTIIDYTISRCQLTTKTDIAFHDLSQESSLFEGDSTVEYQYDIYRYMRSAVYLAEPLATPDPAHTAEAASTQLWRDYHPVTNLVWLHFVLYKLLEQLEWPSARKAPPKKKKDAHAQWKKSIDLEHKLLKIQDLLDPEAGICKNGLRSASDVVGLALAEGWLDVADVVGAHDTDGATDNETVREVVAEAEAPSDGISEPFTHLQINVDVIEEHGLEVAEREAKAVAVKQRCRKKK